MLVEIDYEITVEQEAKGICEKEFVQRIQETVGALLRNEVYVHTNLREPLDDHENPKFIATLNLKSVRVNLDPNDE